MKFTFCFKTNRSNRFSKLYSSLFLIHIKNQVKGLYYKSNDFINLAYSLLIIGLILQLERAMSHIPELIST